MKNRFGWMICLCSLCSLQAMAQYEQWRYPQPAEEVQKVKAAGIRSVAIYVDNNGLQSPYGLAYYDHEGRLVRRMDPKRRQHYIYDAAGRVEKCMDSVHDGRRFVPDSYVFAYDTEGRPVEVKHLKTRSALVFDPVKNETTEALADGAIRLYRYNEDGRLVEELMEGTEFPRRRRLFYNKYGDLASEVSVIPHADGKDSVITTYAFDSKGRLIRRQVTSIRVKESAADPTMPPTETRKTETWSYAYATNGSRTGETYVSGSSAENYRVEWQYDPATQLPVREVRYNARNMVQAVMLYKYTAGKL